MHKDCLTKRCQQSGFNQQHKKKSGQFKSEMDLIHPRGVQLEKFWTDFGLQPMKDWTGLANSFIMNILAEILAFNFLEYFSIYYS